MGIITSFVGIDDARVALLHARQSAIRALLDEVDAAYRRGGGLETLDMQEWWDDVRELLADDPSREVMAAIEGGGRSLGRVRDDRAPARTFMSQQVAAMSRLLRDTVVRERHRRRRYGYDEDDEVELERSHMLRRLDLLQHYLSALAERGLGMVVRGI